MNNFEFENINFSNLINKEDGILSLSKFLNKINYNNANLYIDEFWNSISSNDKWIYIDSELLLWLKYKDIKEGKKKVIKFLKNFFNENNDYNILNKTNFNIENYKRFNSETNDDNRGIHNKKFIVVSPLCFQELCIFVKTSRSIEVSKYVNEMVKILNIYSSYLNYCNLN